MCLHHYSYIGRLGELGGNQKCQLNVAEPLRAFVGSQHARSCLQLRLIGSSEGGWPNLEAPGGTKLACMPGRWEPRWNLYERGVHLLHPSDPLLFLQLSGMSCCLVKWACPLECYTRSFSCLLLAFRKQQCEFLVKPSRSSDRTVDSFLRKGTGRSIALLSAPTER